MRAVLVPPADDATVRAVHAALSIVDARAGGTPKPTDRAWLQTALDEAAGRDPGYEPWPRSSRGATRA